jgi:hypothetical protein
MRLTAALHALDPHRLPIEHLGAPSRASDHASGQLAQLDRLLAGLGAEALPVQHFAATWLRRSPPRASRTSLVHSDMGPGNFLAERGAVTAILDWEVAHWGDPMEDLAAIAVRDMATPIGPLARRYAEYAAAGGAAVDLASIAWYRVFILARNTALIALGLRRPLEDRQREPLARFQLLLLRALALCLCDAVGCERPKEQAIARVDAAHGRDAGPVVEADEADADRVRRFALELERRAHAEQSLLGPASGLRPQRMPAP